MNATVKNSFGYLIGFLLFICLIPSIMWWVAEKPISFSFENLYLMISAFVLIIIGFAFALWTVIYMKRVGKGHPADAFNHEIAPRTQHLMTKGPYRFCRNPMLLGTLVFYIGIGLALKSWLSLMVPAIFIAILLVQVHFEEKRLAKDFENEYLAYKKSTSRLLPIKYLKRFFIK